jgi:pimeloyl-ACP methyl ester carboxylesterase
MAAAAKSQETTLRLLEAKACDKASKEALERMAAATLTDPQLQHKLMCKLLETIHAHGGETPMAQFCIHLLVSMCCSCSGTAVHVHSTSSSPSCCLVICGYAGSSLRVLQPLRDMYLAKHPSWRVVTSVKSGLDSTDADAALAEQVAQIVRAIGSAPRVVVHIMSNNGHGLWWRVLRAAPELNTRIRGIVYDCAASRLVEGHRPQSSSLPSGEESTAACPAASDEDEEGTALAREAQAAVTVATVWMAVMAEDLRFSVESADGTVELSSRSSAELRPAIEAAARAHAATDGIIDAYWARQCILDDGQDVFAWTAAREPAVPTLCLTSERDTIIPSSDVHDWADLLRAAQPARLLRVTELHGTHCQLLVMDGARYAATIEQLVVEALDDASAAARAPPPEGSDAAMVELLRASELPHLLGTLGGLSLAVCQERLAAEGRAKLLAHLKASGVALLAERQKLATAVAKASKASVPVT